MIGDILETFFELIFEALPDIIFEGIRRIGVLIRLPFMKGKSFQDVLQLRWNGLIGLVFIAIITIIVFMLIQD